jgi:bifunctional DNA-binding transcriptional regulator/antitoxin component of YhaV-PrlF toxin-antitoxin module
MDVAVMSKTAEADDRGRIVIPHEIRERYGDRYRIVELDDRVELIPLKEDPIEGLRDAVGDVFAEKSIAEIKQEARDAAREDAIEDVTTSEQR